MSSRRPSAPGSWSCRAGSSTVAPTGAAFVRSGTATSLTSASPSSTRPPATSPSTTRTNPSSSPSTARSTTTNNSGSSSPPRTSSGPAATARSSHTCTRSMAKGLLTCWTAYSPSSCWTPATAPSSPPATPSVSRPSTSDGESMGRSGYRQR
uniref:AsnS2 n=1 Tax=Arundo donax TaxID=35708 RepID=A0A0A9ABY0_ARUDO